MSDGELKKRISTCFITGIVHRKLPSIEALDIIDKAKREIIQVQYVRYLHTGYGMEVSETPKQGFTKQVVINKEAVKKWFGE